MAANRPRQQSRRTFLKVAGLTSGSIALSGCTNMFGSSSSDSVTIQTRHYPTGEMEKFLDTHTKKFEEETGIAVEYEILDWGSGKTKQVSSMQSKTGPDVDEIPSTYIPQFANIPGGFMDITEAGVDIKKSRFYENPTEIGHYKDTFIGIPWFWGPRGHLGYKPLREKAGISEPPRTWDELVSKGKTFNEKFPKKHLFGIPAQENVSHFFADFLWQNGGTLLTDDKKNAAFASDRGITAMNFYKDLQSNHPVMPKATAEWKGDARDTAFINHDIQSTWASLATVDALLEEEGIKEDDIEITKLPAGPQGESATFYGLELVGIHPWTNHPEEAAKWLKYLARPEVNATIAAQTGFLPAVKKSFEQKQFQTPVWQSFKSFTSTGRTFPQVDGWSTVEGIINDAVSGVLVKAASGKWSDGDTKKALKAAEEKATKELERARQ